LLGRALNLGHGREPQTVHYEVAVPALTRNTDHSWVPARLISAALLIAAVLAVYWFISSDEFYVQRIQVTGGERLSEAELISVSSLEGVNIFWVDTRIVGQALEELPYVASASVGCRLPANCGIQLVERKPLFVWRQGDAQAWIGTDGTVLPKRGDLPEATVLNATGSTALKAGDQVEHDLVTAVTELQLLKPEVRVFEYTDRHGLSFRSTQGWLVRLGKGPEMETKLKVLDALTRHLVDQSIVPAFVDVRFPDAPYFGE
jgi:cell division septal protein FtsQ